MSWKLKSGYRENFTRSTWEENSAGIYWNEERVRLADQYQYDVYLYASVLAKKYSLKKVIDVGAGPGCKLSKHFGNIADRLVIVDQPTVESLARKYCPNAEYIAMDLENISMKLHEQFDLIICSDVLEHLLDPTLCLKYIRSHAIENTWIVFSTPERDYLHGISCDKCKKPEHVREWNSAEFASVLKLFDFSVIEHWLCPQIRPKKFRDEKKVHMITPYKPGPDMMPDSMKACQIVVCKPCRDIS